MAIIKSAKKNIVKSATNRVFNIRRKKSVDTVIKNIKTLVAGGKVDEAKALMPQVQKALDKAAKKGTIKKNNASRRKSRLSALIKNSSK